jgi:hypothetical protein
VVNGGLNTKVKDGGLGLGVKEAGVNLVCEGDEILKVMVKEGEGESGAANWVAEDAEARGAFSRRGEEGKGMGEGGSIGGREEGKGGGASGGSEEFGLEEVEMDAMALAKFLEAVEEEGDVAESKDSSDVVKEGHGSSK